MKKLTGDSRTDAAIILLATIQEGARSTDLTNLASRHYPDPRDFGLMRELVGGVLRRRMALKKVVSPHVSRGLDGTRPLLLEILLCHAYQVLFLDRVPAHARVSGAVAAARRIDGEAGARFVNAVTRAVERTAGNDPSKVLAGMTTVEVLSIPPAFEKQIAMVEGRLPDADVLERLARPSPLAVRVSRDLKLREAAIEAISKSGTVAAVGRYARDCLILDSGIPLASEAVPALMVPQDEASQLVVLALDPQPGETILDLCCGTGIKTSQILDIAPSSEVLAVDTDTRKLDRNKELCRLQGRGRPRVLGADATALPDSMDGSFDAVLLDAPCTGAGTMRRRPEVRYARSADDFTRAASLQGALLERALRLVRPGGRLIFATCSFSPLEGSGLLSAVMEKQHGFTLEPTGLDEELRSNGHAITTLPWRQDLDGFFIAKIRRCR